MRLKSFMAALLLAGAVGVVAQAPAWQAQVDQLIAQGEFKQAEKVMSKLPKAERRAQAVRIDSLQTIMDRIRKDFTITPDEGKRLVRERMPQATDEQIQHWIDTRRLEVMDIDGQQWWFRKSIRNLWLLADELAEQHALDKQESYNTRRSYFIEAMQSPADKNNVRDWRHVVITFTLDVKPDAVPAGETLRVWMPYPFENMRQRNIKLEGGNRPVVLSQGSKHHTVYMEGIAVKGQPTHFEYTFSYDVGERHLTQADLLAMLEPYDTSSDVYREFTADQPPHIVVGSRVRELARQIVGDETNPVKQAAMLYEWIGRTLPWAGAREYSTIPCMPEYVLDNGHGDCGQVGLLYISLCRSLGIPARWESGYMLHPGEVNYHDWAETYFEGIGWVPTDPSFGRGAVDTPLNDYYATGIDVYRMASNEAVGDVLSPPKTFIRSETVDFQPGEVEWRGGNLYYDKWSSHLEVDGITPIKNLIK